MNSKSSNRSRLSSKVISSRSRKIGNRPRNRKNRKAMKQAPRNHSKGFVFTEDLGKEIISEIQYSALNSTLVSPTRKIFNEEKDKNMEVVDTVIDKEKTPKTVKFEQNLESFSGKAAQKAVKPFKGLKAFLKRNSRKPQNQKKSQKHPFMWRPKTGTSKFTAYKK